MRQDLIAAMEKAAGELMEWPRRDISLFHHNDADGLSSGALLIEAFTRQGFAVESFSLEKPYPEVLEKVYAEPGRIVVFADFAGRIAPLISDLNRGRNLTLILDHHVAEAATERRVHNLDPDLFGLKGDRDISASTTCYLFACVLDPANADLASIAAIGAVGDGFFVDGCLAGENRAVALEAARQGAMEIRSENGGERYIRLSASGEMPYDELAAYVEVLGGVGYYGGGPELGVAVCRHGASAESDAKAAQLGAVKERAFAAEMARLDEDGLHQSANIQWLHVGERFRPMGVKMIGVFCHALRQAAFVDPDKYIAGFQTMANQIPGFGPIRFDQVKISMRVPPRLEARIQAGAAMGLDTFLPEATARLGGFSDACHTLTAATTVAEGREHDLIDGMEAILGQAPSVAG